MTTAQRTRAADLIARYGQTVAISGAESASYNPATGAATASPYSKSAKAVLLPLSPLRKAANANIKEGDEGLLLSGIDTSGAAMSEPPINAVVTLADGTTKLTLIATDRLDPEGEGSIYYNCAVRRAA